MSAPRCAIGRCSTRAPHSPRPRRGAAAPVGWAYAAPEMRAHRAASAVAVPVHLWNISDDHRFGPARAVDALADQFRNAAIQHHSLKPAEAGTRRLGHFGVFRREPGARLWSRLLQPIEAVSPAPRAAGLERPGFHLGEP
jgi:hypothetical protein